MTIRISHAGASPEGTNSTYVLPDRGVLIDPGPPGDDAWETLTTGLDEAGVALADVEHVVVTHWHMDHAGLAPRLGDAADATVHMHESDAPLLAEYGPERDARVRRDARRLRSWGAPERVVEDVRESDTPSPVPEEYPVTPHADGETLAGLELVHTAGHTQGHLAIVAVEGASDTSTAGDAGHQAPTDAEAGTLFLGDAVLPTYTPNVGGSDTRLADPLSAYLRTLADLEARAEDAPAGGVYPGHGASVDLRDRIGVVREHHAERIDEILAVLAEFERATPWTVARELFGEMAGIHAKMGAGEAAAHLTYLDRQGVVEQVSSTPDQYVRLWDEDPALGLTPEE